MALINCPECGAQVSDQAASCPQCGHPLRTATESGLTKTFRAVWMGLAVAAIVIAMFALLNTCNWKPV